MMEMYNADHTVSCPQKSLTRSCTPSCRNEICTLTKDPSVLVVVGVDDFSKIMPLPLYNIFLAQQ